MPHHISMMLWRMSGSVRKFVVAVLCMVPCLVVAQSNTSSVPPASATDKATDETRSLIDLLGQMLNQGESKNSFGQGILSDFETQIDFGNVGRQGYFESGAMGPGEGGGGEPMAQQFILMARRLALFFISNPDRRELPFDPVAFQKVVDRIEKSVKDESVRDLIIFTDRPLVDQAGVPKAAFFDRSSSTIVVNRAIWRRASSEEKLVLITMEILGLLSIKDSRYENATSLLRDRTAAILSWQIPNQGGFEMPGMRIVGQDPDQFGRLTENDVVIDVGVMGRDSKATERWAKFLAQPSRDREWTEAIERARSLRRPAYFVISSPEASRVVLVAIYNTRSSDGVPGKAAYGLKLSKRRQIYDGPCSGDARSIGVVERVRSCFLDMENYAASDFIVSAKLGKDKDASREESLLGVVTKKLKAEILAFFSQEMRTLQEVTSAHFIQDYSTIVADPKRTDFLADSFRRIVLNAAARANGLVPRLEGPYSQIWFWSLTSNRDFRSDRLFAALETLARNNLGFIEHIWKCGSEQGPRLIALDRLREYRARGACRDEPTTHFPVLEYELFNEMVKRGFLYDARSRTWTKKSTSGQKFEEVDTRTSEFDEVQTRFLTEQPDADGKLRIIREALASAPIEMRFEIYSVHLPRAWLYKISKAQTDDLFRQAWDDILESPTWLHSNWSFRSFTEKSYGIAVSEIHISKDVAQLYRRGMPDFPWFSQPHVFTAWHMAISVGNEAALKPMVLDLINRPTYNRNIARFLRSQLKSSESKSLADRALLIEAVSSSKKLNRE